MPPFFERHPFLYAFGAHHRIHKEADGKHSGSHTNPAKALAIKREIMKQTGCDTKGNACLFQCIEDADYRSSDHCHGVSKAVPLPQIVAQSQQNQHNGNRVDGIQDRNRNTQNHI